MAQTGTQYTKQASVVVGDIPITSADALYQSDGVAGIYTDYMVRNHYYFPQGNVMVGVTDTGGFQNMGSAFMCLENPQATWLADWTAEKRGSPPVIPTWKTDDPNVVLLARWFDPDMLELMADGSSVVYRISGTYYYGFKDPDKARLYHGRPPWMQSSVSMRVLGRFKTGIIAP